PSGLSAGLSDGLSARPSARRRARQPEARRLTPRCHNHRCAPALSRVLVTSAPAGHHGRRPIREARVTRRPWFHVALVAMAVLGSVLLEPSAVAGTASADLSASRSLVTSGASVTLSGTVAGDPTCEAGRAVRLKWRGAGTSGFAIAGESTQASDGSYG